MFTFPSTEGKTLTDILDHKVSQQSTSIFCSDIQHYSISCLNAKNNNMSGDQGNYYFMAFWCKVRSWKDQMELSMAQTTFDKHKYMQKFLW